MYRRSNNAAAERAAAQNQATVKSLLKLEGNKVCADCKRNKHPRWASWNIGVFICIRCSGHHRGMGTHISRVKSVDLDSWTDEQMKSMVKWGNTRANKYWEAKLAPGHVPSEAKIENFIRTKYEAKRWVLPGPIPDPSTLDDHEEDKPDENIPLAIVQEQIKSQQAAAAAAGGPAASASAPVKPVTTRPARQLSLVDDDDIPATLSSAPPSRPSTTQPQPTAATSAANHPQAHSRVTSSASTPAARARPSDSIFGLDLFGPQVGSATSSVSGVAGAHGGARTATGSPAPGAQSRPDLKQSILSLYATPQPQPMVSPSQQQQQQASPGYGGAQGQQQSLFDSLTSPRMQTQQAVPVQQQKPKDAFSGLIDSFSGLSFPSSTSPQPAIAQQQQQHQHQQRRYQSPPLSSPHMNSTPSPSSMNAAHRSSSSLAGLSGLSLNAASPAPVQQRMSSGMSNPLSGGSFFDAPPVPKPQLQSQHQRTDTGGSVFDDFAGFQSAPAPVSKPAASQSMRQSTAASSSSAMDLLGGLGSSVMSSPSPSQQQKSPQQSASSAFSSMKNVFNLSQKPAVSAAPTPAPATTTTATSKPNAISNFFSRSGNAAVTSPTQSSTASATTSNNLPSPASTASAAVAAVSAFPDPWATPAPAPSSAPMAPTASTTITSNAWSTPDPISSNPLAAPAPSMDTMRMPDSLTANDIGSGWGAPSGPTSSAGAAGGSVPAVPVVAADEDFGGWTSAGAVGDEGKGKSGGATGGGNDDLFGNVWG